jgi:hypothetical protein
MLTINLQGGLGNQLFQVAAAETIARESGKKLVLPPCPPTHHSSQDYFRSILADFAQSQGDCSSAEVKLDGYFQTYTTIPPTFRERLVCPPDIPSLLGAFLHIRGGDYVNHWLHDVGLSTYYRRAVQQFPAGTHFYVFTNDVSYAKTIPVLQTISHTFVEEPDEVRALWTLARCRDGGICANSTFSWWGAYLNPDRTLVLPSKWFNDRWMPIEGYYFPRSITIPV